jgi:hypothetical protein
MTKSFARGVDLLLQFLLWVLLSLDLAPRVINTPFTGRLRGLHIVWWLFGAFIAWLAWKHLFCGGFFKSETLGGNAAPASPIGWQLQSIDITKSVARSVDILLQICVWMLIFLNSMTHVTDTPFTGWLRDVHIFWWFLGTFIVWLAWKQLFCGGFAKKKTLGGKKDRDTPQN